MTLPTSGTLSLANIQTEFGGANPIALNEYYAGGSYVPAGTTGTYGAVPSSGTISIKNFYGTSKYIDIQTVTVGTYTAKGVTFYGWVGSSYPPSAISDGTFNPLSGATINTFAYSSSGTVIFSINGTFTDSGWTSVSINGTTYTRASRSSFSSSTSTSWQWTSATNPFGTTTGATIVCNFL